MVDKVSYSVIRSIIDAAWEPSATRTALARSVDTKKQMVIADGQINALLKAKAEGLATDDYDSLLDEWTRTMYIAAASAGGILEQALKTGEVGKNESATASQYFTIAQTLSPTEREREGWQGKAIQWANWFESSIQFYKYDQLEKALARQLEFKMDQATLSERGVPRSMLAPSRSLASIRDHVVNFSKRETPKTIAALISGDNALLSQGIDAGATPGAERVYEWAYGARFVGNMSAFTIRDRLDQLGSGAVALIEVDTKGRVQDNYVLVVTNYNGALVRVDGASNLVTTLTKSDRDFGATRGSDYKMLIVASSLHNHLLNVDEGMRALDIAAVFAPDYQSARGQQVARRLFEKGPPRAVQVAMTALAATKFEGSYLATTMAAAKVVRRQVTVDLNQGLGGGNELPNMTRIEKSLVANGANPQWWGQPGRLQAKSQEIVAANVAKLAPGQSVMVYNPKPQSGGPKTITNVDGFIASIDLTRGTMKPFVADQTNGLLVIDIDSVVPTIKLATLEKAMTAIRSDFGRELSPQ